MNVWYINSILGAICLEEENDALCGFIAGYFAERGLTAEFTGGGTVFTVSKN